ncbi:hypothetical protein BGZ76_007118, partial [Entomortierella beljakovae]
LFTDANPILGTGSVTTPAPANTGFLNQGTQNSSIFQYQLPPPPKPLEIKKLIPLVKNNSQLQHLEVVGRIFYKKRPDTISRLFQVIPLSLKSLVIGEKSRKITFGYCDAQADFGDDEEPIDISNDNRDNGNGNGDGNESENLLNIESIEFKESLLDDSVLIPLLRRCHRLET